MEWAIYDAGKRPRVLLMVSKFDHCLNDLLYRHRTGELKMDIPAIVSNHRTCAPWSSRSIPFVLLPVTPPPTSPSRKRR